MNGEYRGQEVIATVETRLLPPDHNYPDCECMLVLTRQHLYVLEDNFDGTYDTHFEFVLREVDDIVIQKETSTVYADGGTGSLLTEVFTEVVGFLSGMIMIPRAKESRVKRKYIVIRYHDMQGEKREIYFTQCPPKAESFVKSFHKAKDTYGYSI